MSKGGMRFPGRRDTSLWAKVDASTPAKKLVELIDVFGLPQPSAIYSICGHFSPDRAEAYGSSLLNNDLVASHLRGLRTAAEKTGAWVTTRGLRSPAVVHAGRAMLGSKQPCVGITPWHHVFDREAIERQQGDKIAMYPVGNVSFFSRRALTMRNASSERRASTAAHDDNDELLESSHSHFIFIDSAEGVNMDEAQRKRSELEQHISDADLSGDGIETPVVAVVVGGDPKDTYTLLSVLAALQRANPVVVLAGSGGSADDICRSWRGRHRETLKFVPEFTKDTLADPKYRTQAYGELLEQVVTLGHKTGYNATPQLCIFYSSAVDDEELAHAEQASATALEHVLLQALTNDCKKRLDELLFAVRIGLPEILEHVLESGPPPSDESEEAKNKSSEQERVEKALALEACLLEGNETLVHSLIDFNAEAALTFPENLFITSKNAYGVIPDQWGKGVMGRKGNVSSADASAEVSSRGRASAPSPAAEGKKKRSLGGALKLGALSSRPGQVKPAEPESPTREKTVHGLERVRSKAQPQDTTWINILETLVDGYDVYVDVRCGHDEEARGTLQPTWSDLMMWATLAGEHQMTRVLWQQTRFPMRSALAAAGLCASISETVNSEAKQQALERQAARYEQWVLDLLNSVDSKFEAMGMLAMVPLYVDPNGVAHPLYRDSVLDMAAKDDGSPAKRVVAHRHAQELLDRFWCGNQPGDEVGMPPDTSWLAIILQIILFFLPGFIVTLHETSTATTFKANTFKAKEQKHLATQKKHGTRSRIDADMGASQQSLSRKPLRMNTMSSPMLMYERARTRLLFDATPSPFPPQLEDVAKMWSNHLPVHWSPFMAVDFFGIPRVRFLVVNVLNIVYMLLPLFFLVGEPYGLARPFRDDFGRGHNAMPATVSFFEAVFWVWTVAKFMYEVGTVDFSRGPAAAARHYFQREWNKLDFTQVVVIAVICVLRLQCASVEVALGNLMGADTLAMKMVMLCSEIGHNRDAFAVCDNCYDMNRWARNMYAIVTVTVWLRMFDTIKAFKAVGIMKIIFFRMMYNDVAVFLALLFIVSPGYGIASAALQPGRFPHDFTLIKMISNFRSPFMSPWFTVFGDHNLDEITDTTEGVSPTNILLPILLFIYMLITTIVLVNLLIAQMSETYNTTLVNANEEWAYQRAGLIREFKDDYDKGNLPPFNIIFVFWRRLYEVGVMVRRRVCPSMASKTQQLDKRSFKLYASIEYQDTLQRQEAVALKVCITRQDEQSRTELNNQMGDLHTHVKGMGSEVAERMDARIERLEGKMERMLERLGKRLSDMPSQLPSRPPSTPVPADVPPWE